MKKLLALFLAFLLIPALALCEPIPDLCGKTILNLGDSIASASGANGGYAKIIADKYGMALISFAKGGAYLANVGDNNAHAQIAAAAAAGDKPDYILFDGMTNDIHRTSGIQLGEISDGYVAKLDESTFCGGMESACKKLKQYFPGATIIYIRAHNMTRRDAEKQAEWGEKALEICRKWSVPYVDIYACMNTNNPDVGAAYTLDGDGIHPNVDGYADYYAPRIEAVMAEIK